ncbi:T9SS type A sorting domain-containing protein [Microvirga sp. STR05]|uniref:T9SS type A sorting domain-containing protein n=1 Tax=Hymenobacter duratus TaxID=2771356 RepID=A0ABR8JD27_9BACT|nr:M12 family metallo-peptidase [Hymenobacter duratus]MBD2714727.1 T9SS type A sorting domain-containing protein [Hymenobacter duratus]MBR7949632.1 T9SS type A sorting domain-containing protein [Microvirga sp. STR05]
MKKASLAVTRLLLIWLAVLAGSTLPITAQQAPPRRVSVNVEQLRQQLTADPSTSARPGSVAAYRVLLPTLQGARTFVLTETHVLPADDAAARRRLRTYVGYEENAPGRRVSLVLTPRSLTAQLLAGPESASLRPAADGTGYELQQTPPAGGPCGTLSPAGDVLRPENFSTMPAPFSFGTQLRRLRYAILVTQEYYAANGNSDAAVEQAVVAAMNQMSGLYLQELSVSYELVKPNGGTYYFSAMTTATLSSSAAAATGRLREQNLGEVGSFINARFTPSGFDLGHCFHNNGGGVAYVGIICNSTYKAQAWSGVTTSGFQQVLAHEMGHQHGAAHTFTGPCGSQTAGSNLEPGGGATIMAYTDVCGTQTLQNVVGTEADHFNTRSLDQMRTNLRNAACPTVTTNANQPPTVSAGADYVIPRNTPFTLTATGSDPDGETLAYTWNQFDYTPNTQALGTIAGINGLAAIDDPEAPLFRPRPPRTTPSRTFPDLRYVLSNRNQPADRIGEALPNVARDLHFVVTARDQRAAGGTISTDNVTLTVAPNTGPFALTTQNTASLWIGGQQAAVTWSVNGTDQAPIGVSQVRISLSTDGGQTFGTVLAAAAPNTGTAIVTVPNVTTSQARIRVEAVGNIFFDINDADFPIAGCAPIASQTLPATPLTAATGNAALSLTQQGYSLTELTGANQLAGTISATDPTTTLADYNGSTCTRYGGNVTYYDTHVFVPSATASYTINSPTAFGSMVLRVYAGTDFDPLNPCANLLADNYTGSLARSITVSLTAGQSYTLVVSTFNGAPAAGSSYSISFATLAAGGTVYAPLQSLGYDYQYVVVNTTTNQIAQVAPTADLRALPAGTYDVYGFLFQRGYAVSGLQNGTLVGLQAALASIAPCGRLSTNARRVTITGTLPLPVVLTTFTGRAVDEANELQWQTASEQRVAYFEVQRSSDERNFKSLGRVAATNSASAHKYTFQDATPPEGMAYYRLHIQDTDGQAAYSGVVTLQRNGQNQPALRLAAYPNPVPAGGTLQVQVQAREAQTVELTVADALGRTVVRRAVAVPAGTSPLALPEARQWHGLYLLTVQGATGQHQQQKVVLE